MYLYIKKFHIFLSYHNYDNCRIRSLCAALWPFILLILWTFPSNHSDVDFDVVHDTCWRYNYSPNYTSHLTIICIIRHNWANQMKLFTLTQLSLLLSVFVWIRARSTRFLYHGLFIVEVELYTVSVSSIIYAYMYMILCFYFWDIYFVCSKLWKYKMSHNACK